MMDLHIRYSNRVIMKLYFIIFNKKSPYHVKKNQLYVYLSINFGRISGLI